MVYGRDTLKDINTSVEVRSTPRPSGQRTKSSGTATHDRLYRVGNPQVN